MMTEREDRRFAIARVEGLLGIATRDRDQDQGQDRGVEVQLVEAREVVASALDPEQGSMMKMETWP